MTDSSINGYMQNAVRASDFVGSIGVNTHIDFTWTAYNNIQQVEYAINYLGVKNLRDSISNPNDLGSNGLWQQVADATGAKFDDYAGESQPQDAQDLLWMKQAGQQNLLNYVEGVNEADAPWASAHGNSLQLAASFQQQVYATGHALGVPVINMSFGAGWATSPTGDYGTVGDLSAYADYGNAHTYPMSGNAPNLVIGQVNSYAGLAASRPVITTELGWYTQGTTNATGQISETVQAKYTLEGLMDAYKNGDVKTYLYELLDQQSGGTNSENNFGLFHSDGTPKLAAVSLHNLTTLLSDTGANAATFATQALGYSLSGMQATDNSLLMEKSDGSYWLSIWNEQSLTLPDGTDSVIPNHTVTLTLASNTASITVFDPLTGLTAVQSLNGASSATISIPDHPVLVEISALQPAAAAITLPVSANPGSLTSSDLALVLPATLTQGTGTTQSVSVSMSDPWAQQVTGNLTAIVKADVGTISLTDANGNAVSGSGTHSITVSGTLNQLNAELATLSYTAPGSVGTDSLRIDAWNQAGVHASGTVAITDQVPAASDDISVTMPASQSVLVGSVSKLTGVALNDTWAQTASGSMAATVTASAGTIAMTDASGHALTGSGTQSINVSGTLAQINAELATLSYGAPSLVNVDTVRVDAWNQAGVHAAGSVTVADQSPYSSSDLTLNAPASATVAVGTYQQISGLGIIDPWALTVGGTMSATIAASIGTVSTTDASGHTVAGSGTHSITLNGTLAQLNALLAGLTYQAPASAGTDSLSLDVWNQSGFHVGTTTSITDQVVPTSSDIAVSVPASASVMIGRSQAISGVSISDPWASTAAGTMATTISSDAGTLTMTDASGHPVSGSGTHSITVNGTLAQLNAELANLVYNAPAMRGTDVIHMDAWNQAGVYAGKTIAVTDQTPYSSHDLMVYTPRTMTVGVGTTRQVNGLSISDPWSSTSPGSMSTIVSSNTGTLSMTDLSGHVVAGSGSHSITLAGTVSQLNAELATLSYHASNSVGSDVVRMDTWNQAGVHATGSMHVSDQLVALNQTMNIVAHQNDYGYHA